MSTKKSKAKPPKFGVCALLGKEGKFAKSHLIPQALTRPDSPGEYFTEGGRGNAKKRRPTSWYDSQLVILEGEEILSDIDSNGISELRKHKLIWSGWGSEEKLSVEDSLKFPPNEEGIDIRAIKGIDVAKLNLFFLSLLWRALKTRIREFAFLENIGIDLNEIGECIKSKTPCLPQAYPICIHQIIDRGPTHNYSPTIQEGHMPTSEGLRAVSYYRFYMQGVIAHIYPKGYEDLFLNARATFLGGGDELLVFARNFEKSKQSSVLRYAITETFKA